MSRLIALFLILSIVPAQVTADGPKAAQRGELHTQAMRVNSIHNISMSQQSLRVVPPARSDQTTKSISDTANSYGVHDAIRYGARSIATEVQPHHPLENRLQQWDATQDNLKFTMQRRMYGIHAPVRQLMERKIVSQSAPSLFLPKSNIGLDVLMGKDETIDVEDVLGDKDFTPELVDIHARAEAALGLKA